ncbi:MAG: zinc-ribbon domain-containing protein [Pirellulales bacterium]
MPINVTIPAGERQTYRNMPCMWETHPDVAAQLVDPTDGWRLTAMSNKKVAWVCKCGEQFSRRPLDVNSRNSTDCSSSKTNCILKCISRTHPDLAKRVVTIGDADKYMAGAATKLKWRCACGDVFMREIGSYINRGHRSCTSVRGSFKVCPIDSVACNDRDIAEAMANKNESLTNRSGSLTEVEFTCECGDQFTRTIAHARVSLSCHSRRGGKTCRLKSMSVTHPWLSDELLDKSDAMRFTHGSSKTCKWKCKDCGHVWPSTPMQKYNGVGCPQCSGRLTDKNCLSAVNPELASELTDENVGRTVTRGSDIAVSWTCCDCGEEWMATVKSRSVNSTGCPECAEFSRMNKWGRELCEELGLTFKSEWRHDDVRDSRHLPYDIAIGVTKNNGTPSLLLEFDGSQHSSWKKQWGKTDTDKKAKFSDRINKDGIKTRWAWKNKIKLVRILYHHRDCKDGDYNAGEFFRQSLLTELLSAGIIDWVTFSKHSKPYEYAQSSNAFLSHRSK